MLDFAPLFPPPPRRALSRAERPTTPLRALSSVVPVADAAIEGGRLPTRHDSHDVASLVR